MGVSGRYQTIVAYPQGQRAAPLNQSVPVIHRKSTGFSVGSFFL